MSGYNPASTNTSGLPQAQITWYDAKFVENLKLNTFYLRCAERRPLPMNSGNKLELFMYQTFGANIAQVAEGTVGSGITPTVLTNTTTIGQYADYISLSDLARDTALDDALANLRDEIAYRAALSLNTVHRNVIDTAYLIDSSVNALNKAYNSPIVKTDFVNAVQSLQGRAVQPFDKPGNKFAALIHPFCIGDALNDTAVNGITDIAKWGGGENKTHDMLYELPGPETVPVLDVSGCRFYACQMVTQTANYLGHAGVTAFRTYFFGENSNFAISLGGKEGSKIGDGEWRNMSVNLVKNPGTSAADPAGVIGGWTSYNFKYAVSLGPDVTMRLRTIDAPSNVS
jgi:hypothetical protein